MNWTERLVVYAVPVAVLIAEVVCLATGWPVAPHRTFSPIINSPTFVLTTFFITFCSLRRDEVVPLLLLGVSLEATRLVFLLAYRHFQILDTLSAAGLGFWYASLIIPGWRALNGKRSQCMATLDLAAIRFVLPGLGALAVFFLHLTAQWCHSTFDNQFYAFDGLLPVPVARLTVEMFLSHAWLSPIFFVIYASILVVAFIFMMMQRQSDGQLSGHLVTRWILVGCAGAALYFYMPGVGPDFAFYARFPAGLPEPADVPLELLNYTGGEPRNAMPSIHVAWAYLIVIAAWRMRPGALIGAGIFLVATIIATLGLREHYLVDLIVALSLVTAVHGFVSFLDGYADRRASINAAAFGAILTTSWLLAIGFGMQFLRDAPWIAPLSVLGTLTACGLLLLRMERPSGLSVRAAAAD